MNNIRNQVDNTEFIGRYTFRGVISIYLICFKVETTVKNLQTTSVFVF